MFAEYRRSYTILTWLETLLTPVCLRQCGQIMKTDSINLFAAIESH